MSRPGTSGRRRPGRGGGGQLAPAEQRLGRQQHLLRQGEGGDGGGRRAAPTRASARRPSVAAPSSRRCTTGPSPASAPARTSVSGRRSGPTSSCSGPAGSDVRRRDAGARAPSTSRSGPIPSTGQVVEVDVDRMVARAGAAVRAAPSGIWKEEDAPLAGGRTVLKAPEAGQGLPASIKDEVGDVVNDIKAIGDTGAPPAGHGARPDDASHPPIEGVGYRTWVSIRGGPGDGRRPPDPPRRST